MKPRRVVLTLEVETDLPIREWRCIGAIQGWASGKALHAKVIQAQANVIRKQAKQ